MEQVRLGNTGLKVSRLALGCMSYGDPTTPGAHEWSLNDDEAQPFFRQAVELGITFWDTANVYQAGTSEELVGRAIKRYSRREDIVLATKVHGRMHDGPGGRACRARRSWSRSTPRSRGSTPTTSTSTRSTASIPNTPVEETMEALHDVVKAGKVRYIGASSMYAWQFAKLQHAADRGGWTRFVSMQNQYNLLRRQDEPELMAMCADMGVGLVPVLPTGQGPPRPPVGRAEPALHRRQGRPVLRLPARRARRQRGPAGRRSPRRDHGPGRAGVGAEQPGRLCPDRRSDQATSPAEAVAALELQLTEDEIRPIEAPYSPHGPSWY